MSCKTKPDLPRSQMKDFKVSSRRGKVNSHISQSKMEVPTSVSMRTPVETWAQIIHEPPTKLVSKGGQAKVAIDLLAGMLLMDLVSKVLSLLDVRRFGL